MPTRYQKPPRHKLKGWRKPEGSKVVTRPARWSNPYTVAEYGQHEAVRRFEADLLAGTLVTRPGRDPLGVDHARRELAGVDLVCVCGPEEECHAEVLIRYANPEEK